MLRTSDLPVRAYCRSLPGPAVSHRLRAGGNTDEARSTRTVQVAFALSRKEAPPQRSRHGMVVDVVHHPYNDGASFPTRGPSKPGNE